MGIRILFLTAILFVLSGFVLADQPDVKQISRPEEIPSFLGYVPGELIVQFKMPIEEIKAAQSRAGYLSLNVFSLDVIAEKYEVTAMRQLFQGAKPTVKNGHAMDLSRYHKIRFDPTQDLDEVMNAYLSDPNVESVEKNGIHSMYATPNDGYYSYQWYHYQASDHDIDSPEAWDLETGSTSVIIALLDSGTRYFHPDLGGVNASYSNPGAARGNMWINTAELNGSSGYDDDGNGYVDDWIGWDFIDGVSNCWTGEDCTTEDNDPRDFNGHGTHTAGIMGMITNDGYGMAGVAGGWNSGSQTQYGNGVKIMPLRMGYSYNYGGQEYGVVMMDAAAAAFYYAADNGARIASCSWGSSNSGGIGAAATYFINSGGLIFVAAGNDGTQTADYLNGRGDCISVAATDQNDNAASFTTYGTWVDICAPGVSIYSTYHDHTDPSTNYWAGMDGTSMATPMAAAVGGLIWSHNLSWTASQVRTQLYNSADNIDAYLSSTYIGKMGAGRINAYNAVNTGGPSAPVANFSGSPTSGTAPLTVYFTDLSTGDITSWSWDFGDGVGTSSASDPSYTYNNAGNYTVSLTVTGPGGSDNETKTNYITVTGPTSYASLPYSTGFESGSLDQYWTTQSDNSEGRILVTTANGPHSGSYHLTMDDNYDGGLYAQNEAWLHLNLSGESDVELTFWWREYSDEDHTQDGVFFSDNGGSSFTKVYSLIGGGAYQEIVLDVDNLATTYGLSLSSTFVVKFQQYDNYGITTDGMGFDDISVVGVTGAPPVADFSGSPTSGEAPLLVNFTDLSTNNPTSWSWNFGDGVGTSSAQNPNYTYNSAGTYTVSMTATNAYGSDNETKTNYITVTCTAPVANFSGSPTSGDAPLTVNFTDLSTGGPTSWSWDFGDGVGTSSAQNPNYQYNSAGSYTVTLTATNSCGSDQEIKTSYINVTEPGGDYANLPYSTGFETGAFDQYWTSFEGVEGRILITTANGPHAGSYHMTMDDDYSGGSYSQNEAWLHVNLAGKTNVDLKFWHKEWSEEVHTQDGIFFSDNGGSSFTKVYALGSASSSWAQITLDVDALAAANGLSMTGTFVIKFQQYDNYPITSDGMAFDDISVTEVSAGGYAALPYSTGFETGDVDQYWTLIEGVEGWVGVTSSYVPHSGSYHLIMDDIVSGGSYSLNEAWLKVDLAGYSNVGLSFWWKEYADETHTQDGVFFSDNGGSTFTKVYNLQDGSTTWQQINLDVDAICSSYGLNLTGTFVIKFQQYDNYPISSDGFCFDDISVTGSAGASSSGPQALSGQGTLPTEFALAQNYPNPFNPRTAIRFDLPEGSQVRLEIFNILGERVAILVDGYLEAGVYSYDWDASHAASGIYLYRLIADEFTASKKMVLMK